MLLSGDIDTVIGQHHEEKRDVEGYNGAGDGIGLVDHEDTACRVRVVVEFPFLYLRVGGGEKKWVGGGKWGANSEKNGKSEETGKMGREENRKKIKKRVREKKGKEKRKKLRFIIKILFFLQIYST